MLKRIYASLRGPTLVYLLASGLARLGAIVLIPLYTHRLSPAAYGDYALAQTIVSLLPTVLSLGLLSAIPRAYFSGATREEGTRAAGNVAAWTVTLVALHALVALAGISHFARPGSGGITSQWELSCVVVAAAGSALTTIPAVCLRSSQRSIAAAAWQLAEFGTVTGAGLVFVGLLGRGVRGAIEALATAYLVCGIVAVGFVFIGLRGRLHGDVLRRALRFGIPFVPHLIANWAQLASDRWLLKFFGYEADLGRYVLAMQLASVVSLAVAAFHDAESARIGEMFRRDGMPKLRAELRSIQRRYLVATALPSVAVLLALPLTPIFLGPHFRSTTTLVPIMLLLSIVDTAYFPSSNVVYFAGRTKVIPVITVAGAITNLLANLLLVPSLGVFGGLLARGMGYGVRSGALWVIAQQCVREVAPASTTADEAS